MQIFHFTDYLLHKIAVFTIRLDDKYSIYRLTKLKIYTKKSKIKVQKPIA